MANTYDADLIADIISEKGLLVLQPVVPDFSKFSTDFSDDYIPTKGSKATIQVELVTSSSATQKNPSTYGGGDTTNENVPVTVDEYSQPIHLTKNERFTGHNMSEKKVLAAVKKLYQTLWANASAKMTLANFGTTFLLNEDPATVDTDDLATIWAGAEKFMERHIIVNSVFASKFVAQNKDQFGLVDGGHGFDSWSIASDWSGAQANCTGGVFDPSAIATATRLPDYGETFNRDVEGQSVATLDNGMSVLVNNWVDRNSRQENWSLDVMAGFEKGDGSAARLFGNGS